MGLELIVPLLKQTEMTPEEKVARRRLAVKRAVQKWRVNHRAEFNAYQREYLSRPEPHRRHLERCKRYRAKKRRKLAQQVVHDVLVPTVEVE